MTDVSEHNLLDDVDPDNNNFMDNFVNFGSYTLNKVCNIFDRTSMIGIHI